MGQVKAKADLTPVKPQWNNSNNGFTGQAGQADFTDYAFLVFCC